MRKEIAITANSITKSYKLYNSKRDIIKEALHPFRKPYHIKFHALKNVSFEIEKGEVVGIIGQNGSGKSTLLKVLASVAYPTSGNYHCNGKVTALLELSGGFDKEISGIQNIEFLGALQGYSKNEMAERTKQILDFSEIGKYAYQPVKTYSSGMYMRLAFSLSINVEPDILIIDEILAVGDIKFQQKCYNKIQQFKDEGKTIVICTHSLQTVKDFCTRAIWIHEGELKAKDLPNIVVDEYSSLMGASPPKKKSLTNRSLRL